MLVLEKCSDICVKLPQEKKDGKKINSAHGVIFLKIADFFLTPPLQIKF